MSDFYTDTQRDLQDTHETRPLADVLAARIVSDAIPDDHAEFIASRDFFFLATVDGAGNPTVSHKGGPAGFVRVIDEGTLEFPAYDGNGMFLSLGNVAETASIGMLFMDFERPHRVRVQATARVVHDDEALARFPGAVAVVRADVDAVFVNCGRYIHKHERLTTAAHTPDHEGAQPVAAWKRIEGMQVLLPEADQAAVEAAGTITAEEYAERVERGEP